MFYEVDVGKAFFEIPVWTQDEVSDPEEWADMHYGAASSRSRSRSNNATPTPRTMPPMLAAQRRRCLAIERAEEMVDYAEESRERRGVRASLPSSGSSSRPTATTNDEENYHIASL